MSEELMPCLIRDCTKRPKENDRYCSMHRARLERTGRFDLKTDWERLLDRVEMSDGKCFVYTKYRNKWGYGRFRVAGKKILAHRFVWQHCFGQIPKGMLVCHRCDTPACVYPDHLFLGTDMDNVADCIKKGRFKGGRKSPWKKKT